RMLDERMQLKARPNVFLAGQITGVEGYVESCAGGLVCAIMLSQALHGDPITPPPNTTALGGIRTHLGREMGCSARFQPSNITWACIPPPSDTRLRKRERYQAMAERALVDLDRWLACAPQAACNGTATDRSLSQVRVSDSAEPEEVPAALSETS